MYKRSVKEFEGLVNEPNPVVVEIKDENPEVAEGSALVVQQSERVNDYSGKDFTYYLNNRLINHKFKNEEI